MQSKKEVLSWVILAFAILLALSTAAMAADPGHPASSIGVGIVGDIIGGKCDASL